MKDKSFNLSFCGFCCRNGSNFARQNPATTPKKGSFRCAKAMVNKMGKYRRDRINEEMAKELSEIVRQIKDPRVAQYFITVLRTEVTPDLKYAKVFYSVMGAGNEEIDFKELRQGLKSASGFMRGQIAERLNLRITPELNFVYDESIAYGAKINAILHTDSVKEDIRRFDERAAKEAEEAALAQNAEQTEKEGEDEFDD